MLGTLTKSSAKNAIPNSKPATCKATPTPVIVTTANHLPISNSERDNGRLNRDSSVPRSLSPTVMSIAGCTAAEAVHNARTNGMNKDKSIPACSPLVATSASAIIPSQRKGFNVESESKPPASIRSIVSLVSHVFRTSRTRFLASVDCSDVER